MIPESSHEIYNVDNMHSNQGQRCCDVLAVWAILSLINEIMKILSLQLSLLKMQDCSERELIKYGEIRSGEEK